MNRKAFILSGLFLIALAALLTALLCFLLLSRIIPENMASNTVGYYQLVSQVTILLAFGFLIWKRLNFIGKSHQFKACFLAGLLATIIISLNLLPLFLVVYLGINPLDFLSDEIAHWANSGGEGKFSFSTYSKIKASGLTALSSAVMNWPLFAAIYFCAKGPKSPRGNKTALILS